MIGVILGERTAGPTSSLRMTDDPLRAILIALHPSLTAQEGG